jgi:hypothetical protein
MRRKRTELLIESFETFGIVLTPEQRLIVRDLLQQSEQTQEVFTITYPKGGASQTFPEGMTVIDYSEGAIDFGDGTHDSLANNLKGLAVPFLQSFFIETDQTIQVSLDGNSFFQVVQGDFLGLTYQQFDRVYIQTIQDSKISVWASTSPETILSKLKADSIRTAAVYRRRSDALDCSAGAQLDTNFTANFEPGLIAVHFSAAVSPTVSLYRLSDLGSDYDTLIESIDVTSAQDIAFLFSKGESRIKFGDKLRLSISACAATAYAEILTEDV